MPIHRKRKGAVSLEFLLNLLIYIPIFIFLFQVTLIPLQQFYLYQAARSGALIYIQIKHYDRTGSINDILKEMLTPQSNNTNNNDNKNIDSLIKSLTANNSTNVQTIIENFIKEELGNSSYSHQLPVKLFDPQKINVKIEDNGDNIFPASNGLLDLIGNFIGNVLFTRKVTIKVTYQLLPIEIKFFNKTFPLPQLEASYTIRYNP